MEKGRWRQENGRRWRREVKEGRWRKGRWRKGGGRRWWRKGRWRKGVEEGR